MPATCPSDNTIATDQSSFWSSHGVNWDAHRIGWVISGGCAVLTTLITIFSVYTHARHYYVPREQRKIIRILYLPLVQAIIAFFSYRFFRSYTYYELSVVVYEALTISVFMLLIEEYVAETGQGGSITMALERKDKRPFSFPFCFLRYRPSKPYFLHTITWSVMQYAIVRPLVSIVAIIAEAKNVLCENGGVNFHFVYVYAEIINFISTSVSSFGLTTFSALVQSELSGRGPLRKFRSINLIVMFTFYQTFVLRLLEGRAIKATAYWTETNIADGLSALIISIEMVLFAFLMLWAYPAKEYSMNEPRKTNIFRALWDSINFFDIFEEFWREIRFFFDYIRNKPGTRSRSFGRRRGDKLEDEGAGDLTYMDNGYDRDPWVNGENRQYRSQYHYGVEQNSDSPSTVLPNKSSNPSFADDREHSEAPRGTAEDIGRGG